MPSSRWRRSTPVATTERSRQADRRTARRRRLRPIWASGTRWCRKLDYSGTEIGGNGRGGGGNGPSPPSILRKLESAGVLRLSRHRPDARLGARSCDFFTGVRPGPIDSWYAGICRGEGSMRDFVTMRFNQPVRRSRVRLAMGLFAVAAGVLACKAAPEAAKPPVTQQGSAPAPVPDVLAVIGQDKITMADVRERNGEL